MDPSHQQGALSNVDDDSEIGRVKTVKEEEVTDEATLKAQRDESGSPSTAKLEKKVRLIHKRHQEESFKIFVTLRNAKRCCGTITKSGELMCVKQITKTRKEKLCCLPTNFKSPRERVVSLSNLCALSTQLVRNCE